MTGKGENRQINSIADLYREFQQPIFRYLFRLCGSRQKAEELTQETFYRALVSVHRFQGASRVSTWLYKIALTWPWM
ncbi:MAG: RNA polymerase sigma factor [Bacillota bacterium]